MKLSHAMESYQKYHSFNIPNRFTASTTWKGKTDVDYLKARQHAYAHRRAFR